MGQRERGRVRCQLHITLHFAVFNYTRFSPVLAFVLVATGGGASLDKCVSQATTSCMLHVVVACGMWHIMKFLNLTFAASIETSFEVT